MSNNAILHTSNGHVPSLDDKRLRYLPNGIPLCWWAMFEPANVITQEFSGFNYHGAPIKFRTILLQDATDRALTRLHAFRASFIQIRDLTLESEKWLQQLADDLKAAEGAIVYVNLNEIEALVSDEEMRKWIYQGLQFANSVTSGRKLSLTEDDVEVMETAHIYLEEQREAPGTWDLYDKTKHASFVSDPALLPPKAETVVVRREWISGTSDWEGSMIGYRWD